MKKYIVRFTGLHKAAEKFHTYVLAERFKCTDQHYIFFDGDGNVLSQHHYCPVKVFLTPISAL